MKKSRSVEVSVAETKLREILALVEQGEEIVLTRLGEPVAVFSQVKKTFKPFSSHAELLAAQPKAKTSSLETLIALRGEARY